MRRFSVVMLTGALALTGCSSASKTKAAIPALPNPSPSPSSSTTSGEPTPTQEASGGTTPSAGVAVVQSQTVATPISKTGRVVLTISAVQVRGKLAVVDLSFAPTLPDKSADDTFALFTLNGNSFLSPYLVDTVNLKRYDVVMDSNRQSLGSSDLTRVVNGGTKTASYTFAAPPADVPSLDVHVGDFPSFRDVPVKR